MATNDPQKEAETSEDKSQFIRTMAKDMATLGNTPPSAQAKPKVAPKVVLPEPEESFWSKPMPKEVPQEVVELPTIEEAAAITEAKPTPPPPVPPVQTDAEREAVLARLRKKVSESSQMNVQQYPAEAPQAPEPKSEWPDIPTPTPAFAPLAEPVPERIPPVTKEPTPLPSAKAAENIHTFKSDFADRIDTKQANTFSVLAAQQDAAPTPVPQALSPDKSGRKRMIAVIASGILLLILAGGGVFATYHLVMTARNTPVAALVVPSIVFADEYKQLSGSGPELLAALAQTATETLVPGNVLVTYVKENTVTEGGDTETVPAPGSVFVRALNLNAPDILLRNIGKDSTVGVVHAGNETRAFFALRVDSYERTYAGMLTWEPLMQGELTLLYPLYPAEEVAAPLPVASTTATSTQAASTTPQSAPVQGTALTRFSDAVVANYDVRVLKDTNGKTLLLYGYVNKQTLIIARDETAFEILLGRLKPAS